MLLSQSYHVTSDELGYRTRAIWTNFKVLFLSSLELNIHFPFVIKEHLRHSV